MDIVQKVQSFLAAFSCFFQLGKWARRKKKQRMAKQRRSQNFSLCCRRDVVGAVLSAKSRSFSHIFRGEVRFERDLIQDAKDKAKGKGKGSAGGEKSAA